MTTEIDAEGLLPCPLCGAAFLIAQEPHDNGFVAGQWYIYHEYGPLGSDARNCPIDVPRHFDSRAEAIAAWNRRASTSASEAEPVAVTIDREALRKRIENDPDEGEIGAGFEMFTPEAEVALERMAFAALPRWARDELTALRAAATLPTPASDDQVEADYFRSLVERARAAAAKASVKFPQPNYVTLKIAEEAGEVVRGAVHYAENRMEWSEVEGEIVQLLAMLIRFVTEGDQINGVIPPAALAAMGSTKK